MVSAQSFTVYNDHLQTWPSGSLTPALEGSESWNEYIYHFTEGNQARGGLASTAVSGGSEIPGLPW